MSADRFGVLGRRRWSGVHSGDGWDYEDHLRELQRHLFVSDLIDAKIIWFFFLMRLFMFFLLQLDR
jgi:hypothetical protein